VYGQRGAEQEQRVAERDEVAVVHPAATDARAVDQGAVLRAGVLDDPVAEAAGQACVGVRHAGVGDPQGQDAAARLHRALGAALGAAADDHLVHPLERAARRLGGRARALEGEEQVRRDPLALAPLAGAVHGDGAVGHVKRSLRD
jgi:hypothetical protein